MTITKPFYMGVTEVTNAQYRRYRPGHSSHEWAGARRNSSEWVRLGLNGDDQPVVDVSWGDANSYCKVLGFRLPSEAEWEYACRSDSVAWYPWGDDALLGKGYGNFLDAATVKAYEVSGSGFPWDDGYRVTAPVARFRPNGFGLYDMIGNVVEFCADGFDPNEYERCTGGVFDPIGPKSPLVVLRGGGCLTIPARCRSSSRYPIVADSAASFVGFRVVWDP